MLADDNTNNNRLGRTGKVKENTKGHDAKALWRRKVAVGGAHVLVLARGLVQHLDVGRDILVSPFTRILVEHLVRNLAHVELVVPWSLLANNPLGI